MCEYPSVPTPYIGMDLVDTERLADRLSHTQTLANELFHEGEQAYAAGQTRPIEHLAARFAAKEAVIKALGMDGVDPLDTAVIGGGVRCDVRLHGAAAQRANRLDVIVSISLTQVGAVAGAVALARPRTAPRRAATAGTADNGVATNLPRRGRCLPAALLHSRDGTLDRLSAGS
jgi:holo-[acyl-carrier protein] synthase